MKSEIPNPKSETRLSEVQGADVSSFGIRHSIGNRQSAVGNFTLTAVVALASTSSAFACATCYGASDSPLAQGMNWGIMVLLGFIGSVLVAVSSFFVYIVRRASAMEAAAAQNNLTETKQ